MKILIVDDDESILSSLKNMLSFHNHDVESCNNAKDALPMIKNNNYDFLLVDYNMPGNDGIWFMENAKIPKTTKTLLMTAHVNRNIISKMFSLGASGYIIKPFDEKELLKNLTFHSNRKNK